MQNLKGKTLAILIAAILTISIGASTTLLPSASAHTPPWKIPTYAYISAEPSTIGVGQSMTVYFWLDPVYGAAGGSSAIATTSGYTASSALTSNDYRFHNYELTITAPDGTNTTQTYAYIADPTSSQFATWTPATTGTYTFTFTYSGQIYGANGDGYSGSILVNDTYLPSSASTTVTVQSTPIPNAVTSEPLPTDFWTRPIYGENSNWYTISSNWLGTGMPVAGYSSFIAYNPDNIGPTTSHIMWTSPLEYGGIVGGNEYASYPGAAYFEGTAYQSRFTNPIIIDGYLYYTAPVAFTEANGGPTVCVNLQTGQQLWSSTKVPALSFGYIYDLWDGESHGVIPPILVAAIGGGLTGLPATWELFDGFTGNSMFNVTNVPGFAAQTGQTVSGQSATALTTATSTGPSGEMIKYVFMNDGTAANPQWYLAQWNSSDLWQYDVNPYTFGGSLSPSVINASNGVLLSSIPIEILGETGTTPTGGSVFVPYGSSLTDNAFIPLNSSTIYPTNLGARTTFDWNVSIPWLNTMPLQPTYSTTTGLLTTPTEQGTAVGDFAAGGTNPVTVIAANTGDCMLCRNGSLPTGFSTTSTGYPQLPYTLFLVNLNATVGPIGSILWTQNYNPPAGNLTLSVTGVDWQTRVFIINYKETMQYVGYSLTTGAEIWGPTTTENALQYYGLGSMSSYNSAYGFGYGNLYADGMGGVLYAYNDLTGALEWTYGNGAPGSDNCTYSLSSPYGTYPTGIAAIGDGVVYLTSTEHTFTNPIYKGALYRAVNATTGQEIWTLSGAGSSVPIIADGYEVELNGYDMQVYSIGRGPSDTTVQAPQPVVTVGNNALIQGTVMDTSAGTQQTEQKADFPNGVPCASDASMMAWMGYVYQQQAAPTNFTGVTVTLTAIDPNGNFITLGTATTTASGLYRYTWTAPSVPGNYLITATFAGTNGYWGSSAQTGMIVQGATSATAVPTPTPASVANTYFVPAIAGLFIVIIVGLAVVSLLMIRKRP